MIAHISDIHFDERADVEDLDHVLAHFAHDIRERGVDLVVISGDIYERRSTASERARCCAWVRRVAEAAPVVVVRGNHDVERELEILSMLDTHHRVTVYDRPLAQTEPCGRYSIHPLPWIEKSRIMAALGPDVSAAAGREVGLEAVRGLLDAFRSRISDARKRGRIPIVVGHVMLGGSVVSTGQTLIGQGIDLSPTEIEELGAEYAALGHIHATQEWAGGRVCYAGSPTAQNFGELEQHGYRLVSFSADGRFARNDFVPLPHRKRIALDRDWTEGAEPLVVDADSVMGAHVRLRYRVLATLTHTVDVPALERQMLAAGAHSVQIEPIVMSETRARAPELAAAETMSDKLDAYLSAKSIELDDEQRERLAAKLDALVGTGGAA